MASILTLFAEPASRPTPRVARCFRCQKPVLWVEMEGVLRPIDPEPVPWGDIDLTPNMREGVIVPPEVAPKGNRYQPHEDMCDGAIVGEGT